MNSFKKYGKKRSYHMWKYGIICPYHRKGDVVMCDIYRGDTLLCTA